MDTLSGESIDVEDTAALSLRYDNGMIGSLHCTYVTDKWPHQLFFALRGGDGWVRWERAGYRGAQRPTGQNGPAYTGGPLRARPSRRRGTLLVTPEGEATARESGLPYQVLDLSRSKLYEGYRG